jgi:hypothetical protein
LARDAHTGNDPVAAESYLQHAEHYFRLIAAAQATQIGRQNGDAGAPGEFDPEDLDDSNDFGGLPDRFTSREQQETRQALTNPISFVAPSAPQPNGQRQPWPDVRSRRRLAVPNDDRLDWRRDFSGDRLPGKPEGRAEKLPGSA